LVSGWKIGNNDQPEYCSNAINWYNHKFNYVLKQINDHFSKFRISNALMTTYKLIWDDFCSVLLEIIKPEYGKPIDSKTHKEIIKIFENNLLVLHPFMPFISEEIWHLITERSSDEALVISKWPKSNSNINNEIINDFEIIQNIISGIRNIRKKYQISFKESLKLSVVNNDNFPKKYDSIISKLCNISKIEYNNSEIKNALTFRIESNIYSIPYEVDINVHEEIIKIKEDLEYQKGFLNSVTSKLENERFTDNAPDSVVQNELKKKNDTISKISVLEERLKKLEN